MAKEFRKLRSIVLDTVLIEELKWGVLFYTSGAGNIVLIHGFKEYCALLFHKGALLKEMGYGFMAVRRRGIVDYNCVYFQVFRKYGNLLPLVPVPIHCFTEIKYPVVCIF
jgi:hypothetical protein